MLFHASLSGLEAELQSGTDSPGWSVILWIIIIEAIKTRQFLLVGRQTAGIAAIVVIRQARMRVDIEDILLQERPKIQELHR